VGRLVGDRQDGDVGPDGEGLELALVVAVVVCGATIKVRDSVNQDENAPGVS
jgi:hypothetical protein